MIDVKKAIRNSLFSFATSELSQDAFICWCLNWFNDGSKPVLQEMAKKIIFKLTNVKEFVVKGLKQNPDIPMGYIYFLLVLNFQ